MNKIMISAPLIALLACSSAQLTACSGPLPIPVADIVDCVKAEGSADWATIVSKLEPDALSGNWAQLVVDVTALAPTYVLNVVECVGSKMISQYVSAPHEGNEGVTKSVANKAMDDIRALVAKELTAQRTKAGQAAPARRVLFHFKSVCPAMPDGCDL